MLFPVDARGVLCHNHHSCLQETTQGAGQMFTHVLKRTLNGKVSYRAEDWGSWKHNTPSKAQIFMPTESDGLWQLGMERKAAK